MSRSSVLRMVCGSRLPIFPPKGVGFNILDAHGVPIVIFSYLDRTDAAKARGLVEQAIAAVLAIKGIR